MFRGATHKPLASAIGRRRADDQDVFNIFRSAGMSPDQAADVLQNVKEESAKLGLAGMSATVVDDQITSFITDYY